MDRGYQDNLKEKLPSETNKTHCDPETKQQEKRKKRKERKRNVAFRDNIQALSVYYKEALMEKWNLVQNQPLLCQNFNSYKKGKSW